MALIINLKVGDIITFNPQRKSSVMYSSSFAFKVVDICMNKVYADPMTIKEQYYRAPHYENIIYLRSGTTIPFIVFEHYWHIHTINEILAGRVLYE